MIFTSTLTQMAQLILFMAIGFIIAKCKITGAEGAKILSKLETCVFIPALILSTFITQFTVDNLSYTWKLLLFSIGAEMLVIPIAILSSRLLSKSKYIKNIYTYGLSFSNFGFMGNAIVMVIFPDYFFHYIVFCIPLWTLIYVWGVPYLLLVKDEKTTKEKPSKRFLPLLKKLINPMFISLIVGAIIGLSGLKLPNFITNSINICGDCMSPLAMILTGITFAGMDFKKCFQIGAFMPFL